MARTPAELPSGTRVTDFISIGVLASKIPRTAVEEAISSCGKQSERIRQLPAHVMVYYVIALALYMGVAYGEVLRCLVEAFAWLGEPAERMRNTGRSAISQARARLGPEPLEYLYRDLVGPIGTGKTRGLTYRRWRLVSIDGTILDVGDTEENAEAFGRPGSSRGESAFPQVRLVSLLENGTRVLFGAQIGPCTTSEVVLADQALKALRPDMLCMADRGFFSYARWKMTADTGVALLWRMKKNSLLPRERDLDDGSYLSTIYPDPNARRKESHGHVVRVVEYELEGVEDPEPCYKLITTILDANEAPAEELAALYHDRWEIETAFDELKTHLRGPRIVLRSKTPDLVRQEIFGLLLAHFAIRGLMHEAALQADLDPDDLSFVHTVRVVKRKITSQSFPPSAERTAGRPH